MTDALLHAATVLAQVLTRENDALASLDLGVAATLVSAKREATEAFTSAHARLAAGNALHLDAGTSQVRIALSESMVRLRDLAAENRRLLDRAMTVQGHVLDIIAHAVPRASAQAPRYGAAGALVGCNRALPVAIAASA